jgi:hypothetical protein
MVTMVAVHVEAFAHLLVMFLSPQDERKATEGLGDKEEFYPVIE